MHRPQRRSPACCAMWLMLSTTVQGQTAAAPAKPLTYEVVSIKSTKAPDGEMGFNSRSNGFSFRGYTVTKLIQLGFQVKTENQVAGVSGPLSKARFDIEVKVDQETAEALRKLPRGQQEAEQQRMMQQMLKDRFKLSVHRESRLMPIYSLVVAKGGLKIKEASWFDGEGSSMGPGMFRGRAIPLSSMLPSLMSAVDRVIVDNTGLTGKYDFQLEWSTDEERASAPGDNGLPASSKPSLFTALQEQLGLKLEPAKGPVDVIVVDHIEMPSEN